jgi:hypothetical protein
VSDRATLDAMHDDLRTRGFVVSDIFEEATSFNAKLSDPDGLVIELTTPKR